jgi:hypothetical protein
MAFSTKDLVVGNETVKTPDTNNELSLPELEFLLTVLRNVDLKGHQVEMFYNMSLKIQNQYIKKTKQ